MFTDGRQQQLKKAKPLMGKPLLECAILWVIMAKSLI
jgi:hypothetical protein